LGFYSLFLNAQQAWVVDTTFKTNVEHKSVTDIEFYDDYILISGLLQFESEITPCYSAKIDYNGNMTGCFSGGGGIVPWSNRYYIGIGQSILRKFESGVTDNSFNTNSIFYNPIHAGQFVVLPDDKVLATGGRDLYSTEDTTLIGSNFCLTRYDTLGNLDSSFQHRQCQFGIAQRIVAHPDGRFLVSGVMDVFDGEPVGHIFKVNYDGSLDTTFHTNIDFGSASDYYFYNDGRILASGWFHSPEFPNDTIPLVRLMPDGAIDHSFNYDIRMRLFPNSNWPGIVQGMYTLDSATIFLAGSFATLNDEWVGGVFAIDTAGNILPEYFPGTNCDTVIGPNTIITLAMRDFEMGPDGMLYAYGSFHGFDDGYQNHPDQTMIIRLKQVNVGVEDHANELPLATLSLFPNPATNTVTFDYFLQHKPTDAYLVVRDVLGREMFRQKLTDQKRQLAWDTEDVAPGTYAVTLVNKARTLRAEKLVIHH